MGECNTRERVRGSTLATNLVFSRVCDCLLYTSNRRTADLNGRNDSGNAESGHPTLSYAGTESEIAKIKQRVIRAAQHFAK